MFQEINDWLMKRCGRITASEIYKIIGKGRSESFSQTGKTYLMTKAAELYTAEPIQKANTQAMEWGKAHEFEAMMRFQKEMDTDVEYFGGENPTFYEWHKYAGGSPDGLLGDYVVEIKCPFNQTEHLQHYLIKDADGLKDYAPEYYWQILANILFTGKKGGYFVSYDNRFEGKMQIKILKMEHDEILLDLELLELRLQEAINHLETIFDDIEQGNS